MQRFRTVVAASICIAAAVSMMALSSAAADSSLQQGSLLPQLTADRPSAGIRGDSADFILLQGGQDYDELDPVNHFQVLRRSDGQVVREFDRPVGISTAEMPQLVRDDILELSGAYDQEKVTVTDAATGGPVRTMDLSGYGLLHADPDWAMVAQTTGPTTGDNGVSFLEADGNVVPVPGNWFTPPTWVGGDGTSAYVTAQEGNFELDPATGAKTLLPFPDGAALFAVTPTLLIARQTTYANGGAATHFTAINRSDLAPAWSTSVVSDYHDGGFVPLGDGIAQLYIPDAPSPVYEHMELRPVDLATGALGTAIVNDVYTFDELEGAQVALTIWDSPGGRLVIADGTSVTSYLDLPDEHARIMDIGLSGTQVAASWEMRTPVSTTRTDASGAWEDTYASPAFGPGDEDETVAFRGDVVMTSHDVDGSPQKSFRLQWPGGSRDFSANMASLGHGGAFVQRSSFSPESTDVENVRTGAVVASYPDLTGRAIDGSWIWDPPDSTGSMVGTDLTGVDPDRRVQVPAGCASADLRDVRGRWAWLACSTGSWVLDLEGGAPARSVSSTAGSEYLGNGFFVVVQPITTGTTYPLEAQVTDLVTGSTRAYGPIRGNSYPPGIGVAVNDAGDPDLVYLDTRYQARHVSLDWLRVADPTPLMLRNASLPRLVAATTARVVSPAWSYLNGASFEVRRSADRSGSIWPDVAQWTGLGSATVTDSLSPGSGACFEARAHGADGSVTGWSAPVCEYVDGAAPTLTAGATFSALVRSTTAVSTTATWQFTDDDAVASYDVRSEPRGGTTWSYPTDWQHRSTGSVTTSIQPGEGVCLSARARDRAGHVSPWSAAKCRYVDGEAPVLGDPTGSVRYPAVLGGTASFSLSASDDDQVASYDVDLATAAAGHPLGSWVRKVDASTAGRLSVTSQPRGSEFCFRGRARDTAGNISGWSVTRCTVAPLDDRAMTTTGNHRQLSASSAVGGTLLSLWGNGSRATLSGQTGKVVAVWVQRGPGLGKAQVYAGGTSIGWISFAASSAHRALVLLPVPGGFSGAVLVIARTTAPVRVDAIAVRR